MYEVIHTRTGDRIFKGETMYKVFRWLADNPGYSRDELEVRQYDLVTVFSVTSRDTLKPEGKEK